MFNKKKTLKNLLLMFCILVLLLPGDVLAMGQSKKNNELKEADKQLEIIKQYLTYDGEEKNIVIFDYNAAIEKNESEEIIELGKALQEVSIVYSMEEETYSNELVKKVVIPVWGNYCGPGWGTKDSTKPTTDILDQGCKAHDNCYKGSGYKKNCKCNKNLINHIDRNYNYMTGSMKTTAFAIRSYFKMFGLIGC